MSVYAWAQFAQQTDCFIIILFVDKILKIKQQHQRGSSNTVASFFSGVIFSERPRGLARGLPFSFFFRRQIVCGFSCKLLCETGLFDASRRRIILSSMQHLRPCMCSKKQFSQVCWSLIRLYGIVTSYPDDQKLPNLRDIECFLCMSINAKMTPENININIVLSLVGTCGSSVHCCVLVTDS